MSEIPKAVEAARRNLPPLFDRGGGEIDKHEIADACVRAALPAIREQARQDLEAALLSEEAVEAALGPAGESHLEGFFYHDRDYAAQMIRDILRAALSAQTGGDGA